MASSSSGGKRPTRGVEAEERRRVRQRSLQHLKNVSGVSDALLAKIIEGVRKERILEDPKTVCRLDIRRAGNVLVDGLCVEAKLATANGADTAVTYLDPCLMMSRLSDEAADLQEAFEEALRLKDCREDQPWSIVVSMDEYTGGNALCSNNMRWQDNGLHLLVPGVGPSPQVGERVVQQLVNSTVPGNVHVLLACLAIGLCEHALAARLHVHLRTRCHRM